MPSQAEFHMFATKTLYALVMPLLEKKGKEYTDGDNAFVNFDTGGELLKCSPEQYLLFLATKHWQALSLWTQGKAAEPPTMDEIFGRAIDIVIYMLLLMFMVKSHRQHSEVEY